MIAGQIDRGHAANRRSGGEQAEHARTIRPPVDQIAQMHQQRRRHRPARHIRRDRRMQDAEFVELAVHVADGVNPLAGRQAGRGAREHDPARSASEQGSHAESASSATNVF